MTKISYSFFLQIKEEYAKFDRRLCDRWVKNCYRCVHHFETHEPLLYVKNKNIISQRIINSTICIAKMLNDHVEKPHFGYFEHYSKKTGINIYMKPMKSNIIRCHDIHGALYTLLSNRNKLRRHGYIMVTSSISQGHFDSLLNVLISFNQPSKIYITPNISTKHIDNVILTKHNICVEYLDIPAKQMKTKVLDYVCLTSNSMYLHTQNDALLSLAFGSIGINIATNYIFDVIVIPAIKNDLLMGIITFYNHYRLISRSDTKIVAVYEDNDCLDDLFICDDMYTYCKKHVDLWIGVKSINVFDKCSKSNTISDPHVLTALGGLYKEKTLFHGKNVLVLT